MTVSFSSEEWEAIDLALNQLLGGVTENSRKEEAEKAVRARMRAAGTARLQVYLQKLGRSTDEQGALAALLTVGETYFFRSPQHFTALREAVLPEFAREGRSSLRILSAACASGEEPYSIAMEMQDAGAHAEIWGVDVNPAALKKAEAAAYTEWSLRSVTAEQRRRFFERAAKQWRVREDVRHGVRFQEANLLTLDAKALGGQFDVIFCRNAFIYFSHDGMVRSVERMAEMLRPGGYLFLGPAETLRGVSRAFSLCHTHETFYYRRGAGPAKTMPTGRPELEEIAPDLPVGALTAAALSTAWFDAIGESARRVEQMQAGKRAAPQKAAAKKAVKASAKAAVKLPVKLPATLAAVARRAKVLVDVIALAEEQQFAEALEKMDGMPGLGKRIPAEEILRAALLMQAGRADESVTLSRAVLAADELSAESHYLLSVGLEKEMPAKSMEHAKTAAYLDATFAMAQMRAGMMLAKAGETERAREQFAVTKKALATDDQRRLVLFGGGFSQAGLRRVCDAELNRLKAKE